MDAFFPGKFSIAIYSHLLTSKNPRDMYRRSVASFPRLSNMKTRLALFIFSCRPQQNGLVTKGCGILQAFLMKAGRWFGSVIELESPGQNVFCPRRVELRVTASYSLTEDEGRIMRCRIGHLTTCHLFTWISWLAAKNTLHALDVRNVVN